LNTRTALVYSEWQVQGHVARGVGSFAALTMTAIFTLPAMTGMETVIVVAPPSDRR
jgi:hypothetical protein